MPLQITFLLICAYVVAVVALLASAYIRVTNKINETNRELGGRE
jgi:hypothetical protein